MLWVPTRWPLGARCSPCRYAVQVLVCRSEMPCRCRRRPNNERQRRGDTTDYVQIHPIAVHQGIGAQSRQRDKDRSGSPLYLCWPLIQSLLYVCSKAIVPLTHDIPCIGPSEADECFAIANAVSTT